MAATEKPYSEENENYNVKIQYFEYNKLEDQKLSIDSTGSKIFKIESNQYSINHLVDTLANEKRNKTDFIINLKLESKKGITKKEFVNIIKKYDQETK